LRLGGELFYIPYNGGGIGSFKPDVTRAFKIKFAEINGVTSEYLTAKSAVGATGNQFQFGTGDNSGAVDHVSLLPEGNFSYETAPATVSFLTCISY
jgi:hypothetical protein